MSTLGFPTNPQIGDTHRVSDRVYTWNGTAWLLTGYAVSTATTGTFGTTIVTTTTNSTGTNSGALQVTGGAGIGGDLYVGGSIYSGGSQVLTTSSYIVPDLQSVTDVGSTTTNTVSILSTANSISTETGALTVAGGVGVGGDIWVEGRVNSESLKIADSVLDSTAILVNNSIPVVVDQYPISQFRSAKYLIQIDEGMGIDAEFEVIEILLLVDNNRNVYATEYGLLTSNGDMGVFEAEVTIDGMVKLYFTAYDATNKVIKVLRTGMAV